MKDGTVGRGVVNRLRAMPGALRRLASSRVTALALALVGLILSLFYGVAFATVSTCIKQYGCNCTTPPGCTTLTGSSYAACEGYSNTTGHGCCGYTYTVYPYQCPDGTGGSCVCSSYLSASTYWVCGTNGVCQPPPSSSGTV